MRGNNRSGRYAEAALTQAPLEQQRLGAVEAAFASLPERYLGADPGFSASYRIELDDLGLSWAVELDQARCEVTVSPKSDPDVVIGTDAATWLELREGRLSGLDAFRSRRLWARGNLDLAVAFEGFFKLPNGRPPLLRIHEVRAGKARISTLTAGDGIENVILIHGLGSNKTSFFETVSALTPQYTVHAIDLPGFGSSSKPLRAPYDAAWFARAVTRFMDAEGIQRAHLVGNSLGGRVAIEVGLREPDRVRSLSLLCPSMAWRKRRHFVPLVKLLRPELAAIPHTFGDALVRQQFWSMFSRPERIHPSAADVAVEEFLRTYRSVNARVAFHAAARHIYLEEPKGPNGLLDPAAAARAAGDVRLGRRGPARSARLLPRTSATPCRRRARWCSSSAGTSRRSSTRSMRTRWSTTSSVARRPQRPSAPRGGSAGPPAACRCGSTATAAVHSNGTDPELTADAA